MTPCGRTSTMTTALFGPSVPRQAPAAGVTVYCHVPVGTALSVQVTAETIPLQDAPTVCAFPSASYRLIT